MGGKRMRDIGLDSFGFSLPSTQASSKKHKNHDAPRGPSSGWFRRNATPPQEHKRKTLHAEAKVIDLTGDPVPYSTAPPPRTKPIVCNCGKLDAGPSGTVQCANPVCSVKVYHRACVGLSNIQKYKDTSTWKCRNCRVPPPPTTSFRQEDQPTTASAASSAPHLIPVHAPEPPLHEEQAKIVNSVEEGHNVFYTGSAGTGKSTVLKAFVKSLKAQGKQVDIVAPSGIAALAIGGSTIYSYAGWHPDVFKDGLEALIAKARGKNVHKRLCRTDVLIIDEISMVESDMLTRLDDIMRAVRDGWKPQYGEKRSQSRHSARLAFGGVQIVVTGDFCQLPPVKPFHYCLFCGGGELEASTSQDGSPKTCKQCHRVYQDKDKWAFFSPAWKAARFRCFELQKIHRQNDAKFISILQNRRLGKLMTQEEKNLLLKKKKDMDSAVKLLPQKSEVNRKNMEGLRRLRTQSRVYDCVDSFDWRNQKDQSLKDKGRLANPQRSDGPLVALRDHRFEERTELKSGMLVILLVNLDLQAGLVNGSQGKIVGFEQYDPHTSLIQRPPPSSPSRTGKASKESDALSEIAAFKEEQIRHFIERAPNKEWPVVQFNNGMTRPIYASCQMHELGSEKPYSILSRTSIPLQAAWAITCHKSQGMTLDRVSVDLYNSFEKEMIYVALSRARSLEGLEVIRLPREDKQGMNPEVLQFLKENVWLNGQMDL